jgi:DNA modification methylase
MKSHEMVYVFSKKGAFYRRVNVDIGKQQWTSKREPDRPKSRQYGVSRDTAAEAGAADGKRCPLSVIPIPGTFARGGHPTEKPLKLYTWLLERYVPDGGTVLDPTAGSFNSILAARALGYKAIGIEMDTNFFWRGVAKLK